MKLDIVEAADCLRQLKKMLEATYKYIILAPVISSAILFAATHLK